MIVYGMRGHPPTPGSSRGDILWVPIAPIPIWQKSVRVLQELPYNTVRKFCTLGGGVYLWSTMVTPKWAGAINFGRNFVENLGLD